MRRTLMTLWALPALLACISACSASATSAPRSAMAEAASYAPGMAQAAPPALAGMAPETVSELSASGGDSDRDSGGENRDMELAKTAPPPPPPPPPPGKTAPAGQGAQPTAPGLGQVSAVRAPMLIYTAQLTMAVFEVSASLAKVEALSQELGGFLALREDMTITIRVPVARFDEALQRIAGFGDVVHRSVVAQDVTEEFLDLEIRLRNARAVRDRLEKLLEKAAKVEESIALERELARVAGELERLAGRMKYLRDRAAFSTITISFQPRPTEMVGPSGPRLPVDWLNELGLSRLLNL
jgi:Domain of unknown function (DUF4349)